MKKKTLCILAGILTGIICCYLVWLSRQPVLSPHNSVSTYDTGSVCESSVIRSSIAFILGDDREADNPYYHEALRYYTTNPDEKTDHVIRTCRSLTEVKNYLKNNRPSNGVAWGTIHLVSHGNQWTGLSVKVTPESKRATAQRIIEHTQSGLFESLDQTVVDSQTTILMHGCGVGNNRHLVDAVSLFFGGQSTVFAPKLFEYYASTGAEKSLRSQRYIAQNWFVSYPMGNKPPAPAIANELREKYPDARVDWQNALLHEQPAWIGDAYHYTFEVPVKWIIPIDSIPDLASETRQTTWLHTQPLITQELEALQIPIEKFKWSLTSGYTQTKDGLKTPAVFVKGYCTMLCVLRALTADHNNHRPLPQPFTPALTDSRFYALSGGSAQHERASL